MEARLQQVASLRKQGVQVIAAVLQSGRVAANAETHFGRLGFDPECLQQFDEVRVGPVVINDKPGIDGTLLAAPVDIDGRGVATDTIRRRFLREAQVLAALSHPNIARVYEAGAADTADGSRPFIAMELVDGTMITLSAS